MSTQSALASSLQIAQDASFASRILKAVSGQDRSTALTVIHAALGRSKDVILEANKKDMEAAQKLAEVGGMMNSMSKRLFLSEQKWDAMLAGVLEVRNLEDLVGKVTLATKLDEGLELYRLTSPIGVLLVIFEARPEVIVNIASLALKSGNAVILKGGKESINSFAAISRVVSEALQSTNIPPGAVQLVETRDDVNSLLDQDKYIDLVIPRGSNELVQYIKHNTKIPVMGHADGICSIYVHEDADEEKSVKVIVDSKTDYPAACNAVETILIHESITSTKFLSIASELLKSGVSLRCDEPSRASLESLSLGADAKSMIQQATEQDYYTEFLELIVAVKVVSGLDEAALHIDKHGSGHTDCILTESKEVADKFINRIDSAGVYWNASTRFADGYRYGFGTEVGISTNKIHARGPVGLEGLMIYKYQLRGNGQIVGDYSSGKKQYIHQKIDVVDL